MIFLTVGTQLPFDRLVEAVDAWAGQSRGARVFAQIASGRYQPRHCEFTDYVAPSMADDMFRNAELIVSHAGMGSILTALKYRKNILILPRKASLGEHRNEHQLATAKWLGTRAGIFVAEEAQDIARLLNERRQPASAGFISDFADPALIDRLRSFLDMDAAETKAS